MLQRDLDMEACWQRLANDLDPFFATFRPLTGTYGEDDYYASGCRDVDTWLARISPAQHRLALDIGTGLGRLAFALAGRFERVIATDISPRYVAFVNAKSRELGAPVHAVAYDDHWDHLRAYDLIVAVNVLCHVANDAHLRSYFENIAQALADDGIAILHFDTRRKTLSYRLRNAMPDFVLPTRWRRGFRRIRRSSRELAAMYHACGLTLVDTLATEPEQTHLFLRRAS